MSLETEINKRFYLMHIETTEGEVKSKKEFEVCDCLLPEIGSYRKERAVAKYYLRKRCKVARLAIRSTPRWAYRIIEKELGEDYEDLDTYSCGKPDLFVYDPVEDKYKLVEVKSWDDTLTDKQEEWFSENIDLVDIEIHRLKEIDDPYRREVSVEA